MQTAKKIAVFLGVRGEDPNNLEVFCTSVCFANVF